MTTDSKRHELKILPEYFNAVICGEKTFEIRKNDRNFQRGDVVCLMEYDGLYNAFTGRQLLIEITYVLNGDEKTEKYGLKKGFCVFSFIMRW